MELITAVGSGATGGLSHWVNMQPLMQEQFSFTKAPRSLLLRTQTFSLKEKKSQAAAPIDPDGRPYAFYFPFRLPSELPDYGGGNEEDCNPSQLLSGSQLWQ